VVGSDEGSPRVQFEAVQGLGGAPAMENGDATDLRWPAALPRLDSGDLCRGCDRQVLGAGRGGH
jgi:hypothetical protein